MTARPGLWDGAVLCGGGSTRMGTDKALLPLGGRALAGRVADALVGAGAREVVAIGGDAVALDAIGFSVVADRWPGEGPLGATLCALEHSDAPIVVVAACDLASPCVEVPRLLVDRLLAAPEAGAAMVRSDGVDQPQLVAWRTSVRATIESRWCDGERSVRAVVRACLPTLVELSDPSALDDIDDPATYSRYARRVP